MDNLYLKFIDSQAEVELQKILLNTRVVNQIGKLSGVYQTSALEAFHSVINQFAPKMYSFSYGGMEAR